jgi:hypothetical protein
VTLVGYARVSTDSPLRPAPDRGCDVPRRVRRRRPAHFERELIRKRTVAGLATPRCWQGRGKTPEAHGPADRDGPEDARLREHTIYAITETLGVARSTLYRILDGEIPGQAGCGSLLRAAPERRGYRGRRSCHPEHRDRRQAVRTQDQAAWQADLSPSTVTSHTPLVW